MSTLDETILRHENARLRRLLQDAEMALAEAASAINEVDLQRDRPRSEYGIRAHARALGARWQAQGTVAAIRQEGVTP